MKKPMIKALALSLAFTMALSTPVATFAEGIKDFYSNTEESNNDTNTNTNTNTDTNTRADEEDMVDEKDYAKVIGLVVDPEVATVVVGEDENPITLTATILVDNSAQEGTGSIRAMSLDSVDADEVLVLENGKEVKAADLFKALVWYEESEENNVKLLQKTGESVDLVGVSAGTATVSVKLDSNLGFGETYKASATVNVKSYSTIFKLNAPKNPYVKHVIDMTAPEILERDGNEEVRWNVFQKINGTLKKAKVATITADGQLTLKKVTKTGEDLIVVAITDRGKIAQTTFAVTEGNPIKKMYRVSPSNGKVPEMTITVGETVDFILCPRENVEVKYDVKYSDKGATTDYIKWSSNKTAIAEVEATENTTATTATITGNNPGKAVITAKSTSGKSVKFNVTVKAPLTAIDDITASKDKIYSGQTVTLTAVKVPYNSNESVKFKINDKNQKKIATVTSKGVLKAKKGQSGTVTVTAYGKDANKKLIEKNVDFTIEKGTITDIVIKSDLKENKGKYLLTLYKNKMYDVEAEFKNGDEAMATWASSKTKVATVNETGVIEAKTNGKANITVSAEDADNNYKTIKKTIALTVLQPVEQIQLNKTDVTVNPKNKDQKVKLQVSKMLPKGCQKEDITWTVAYSDVAGVGFAKGKATQDTFVGKSANVVVPKAAVAGNVIVVKAQSKSGASQLATITVCNKTSKVAIVDANGAKFTKNTATIAAGKNLVLDKDFMVMVTAKNAKNEEVVTKTQAEAITSNNETIISLSANKNFVRIEEKNGEITVYGLQPGTATVTAKLASGKKATFKVKVTEATAN